MERTQNLENLLPWFSETENQERAKTEDQADTARAMTLVKERWADLAGYRLGTCHRQNPS